MQMQLTYLPEGETIEHAVIDTPMHDDRQCPLIHPVYEVLYHGEAPKYIALVNWETCLDGWDVCDDFTAFVCLCETSEPTAHLMSLGITNSLMLINELEYDYSDVVGAEPLALIKEKIRNAVLVLLQQLEDTPLTFRL